MPKTRISPRSASDTKEARLMALKNFTPGTYVRHKLTGQLGLFCELNLGYALPEVWVQFESNTDICVPTSCNPLELELLESTEQQMSEIRSEGELTASSETVVTVETTATTIDVLEELTEGEVSERQRLELKVERAFFEAGAALRELRDRRLYRSTHGTFEEYCQDRFGFHRRHSYQLIDAADVVENLCANGAQNNLSTSKGQILPTTERQIRPLAKLEASEQRSVWQQAVKQASGKVPSGRIVKGIVEQLKAKPLFKATDFCHPGDVFTLMGLTDGERKYNGYWAIAFEVKDFTVVVDVHDGTIAVKPENLNKIDDPEAHRQLPQILQRLGRVRGVAEFGDRAAYVMLEHLGKQTYLTPLEDKLLQVIEREYGVEDANSEVGS